MTLKVSRLFLLIESIGFCAFVAWYIWQLQTAFRYSWIVFPVWLLASFTLHKDAPQSLGWRADNFWGAAKRASAVLLPCALAIAVTGLFRSEERRVGKECMVWW